MSDTYYVYAICWGGGNRRYLQTEFSGTRRQCEQFIKGRASAGRPTHFLFISKLDIDRASKRYLP